MKFIDEYSDGASAARYAAVIAGLVTRPWILMEICGGQTHSIVKSGIDSLLPDGVALVHGPGCPVCVTPVEMIDRAIEIAGLPGVTLCSFGDMLRVPGSACDLLSARAAGADVRIVYSPMDALKVAAESPDREVVFFAVGFETTAPANAMAVYQARARGLRNFSALVSHVLVPPAMEAILSSPQNRVQGFLAAGHVCTVMGYSQYEPLAAKYRVPIVVTGFEPLDLLQGITMCIRQLEESRFDVENQYSRSVSRDGNRHAQEIIQEVFQVVAREWRGIGVIPESGLGLRVPYAELDADSRFPRTRSRACDGTPRRASGCESGLILQGIKRPSECPAFAGACTPEHPIGATMVSSEGACAAYYRYRRHEASGRWDGGEGHRDAGGRDDARQQPDEAGRPDCEASPNGRGA